MICFRRATLVLCVAGAFAMSANPPSLAQQSAPSSPPVVRQPYNIVAFGAFRLLILSGDFSPKVALAEALSNRPTTGVGAVAEARGEITVYDGKLIVSYGEERSRRTVDAEYAALLATGTVASWQTVTVDYDVPPEDTEAFLGQTARAHGIDPEGSFPFQIRGTLTSYVMHVIAAPTNGPHGMGQPIAITRESMGDTIEGGVAGIYVSRDLVGVISHGGTRTHAHWVAPDARSTAHLDRWGLKAGATLSLPKP